MRTIYLLLFFCFFATVQLSYGQDRQRQKNNVFIEQGGLVGLINYERKVYFKENKGLILGLGYTPSIIFDGINKPIIPLRAELFVDKNKHSFSLGGGASIISERTESPDHTYASRLLGMSYLKYKYSFANQRLNCGILIGPIFNLASDIRILPWGGFQVGYYFGKKGE